MYRSSTDGRRWVAVGMSAERDATVAGDEALASAFAAAGRDDARLLVVFAADSYDLARLVAALRAAAPGVPLIGCTTAGEMTTAQAGDDTVVVTLLGGPGFRVATTLVRGASDDLRGAGRAAAAIVSGPGSDEERPHEVLLLLTDGLAGDQQEIVRGAYATVGASVPIVGGCAGDGLRMRRTRQLHGDEVTGDAIVAAAISSDAPIGIGVRHGWGSVGSPMLVTSSRDNRVHRLDDAPALDVYLDRLAAPPDVREDLDAFRRFAITHPIGLRRRSGLDVRFIGDADLDERSLVCIAEVPQGELVSVLEGGEGTILDATDAACAQAGAELGEADAIGLLAFDCIGRRGVLGDAGLPSELGHIRERFPAVPLAGFYTYGEFARVHGSRGFHNQTLVLLALA